MKKYSAAIIGCGNVAGMYGSDANKNIQSHAQAYQENERTVLKAIYDPDRDKLKAFSKKWGVDDAFTSLEEMIESQRIDIISICSPTQRHFEHFEFTSAKNINAIFAEKPLSDDLDEAKKIVEMTKDMTVAVNYFRRWNKDLQKIKLNIDDNSFGDIKKVIVHYTKGIKNNGTHILDLLFWFFGKLNLEQVFKKYTSIDNDIGVDCLLSASKDIPIIFSHVPDVDYVYIEIEILSESGVLKINQRGQSITVFSIEKDPDYSVFNRLIKDNECDTRWKKCFEGAVGNIISNIESGEKLLCTPEDALITSILAEEIIQN